MGVFTFLCFFLRDDCHVDSSSPLEFLGVFVW